MARAKSISSVLTDLTPKRLATIESLFKKTEESPREGEQFFLELKMNLNIGLQGDNDKKEDAEKQVCIITTGNTNVFAGTPEAPEEKRLLAECMVQVESIYQVNQNTTEDDLKKHGDFFKSHSSIVVYNTIRALVANTDFHNMPLPLPR